MQTRHKLWIPLIALGLMTGSLSARAAGWCESGKPIKFAGLNWESGMLLTDVMQYVLQKGYDCKTDALPGNSITMEQAVGTNDIQVFAEEWIGRSEVWNKAEKSGKAVSVGAPIVGAVEGWYVPRYVIEGDAKRNLKPLAPDLKSIPDLAKYVQVFRDQEEPDKGRFYNCPAGWTCELDNTAILKKFKLDDKFTNFRPGTGPALDTAILSSYRRGEPILFYYWSPTPIMGQLDLVKLDEPGVDKNIHIKVGISSVFNQQAPELVQMLSKVNIPLDLINQNLARMSKERISSQKLALEFFKQHPDIWKQWVSEDAAKKIQASL